MFSKTTDTLEISENPDDPEKEATSERGELYLLNRGVGKPAANLPWRQTWTSGSRWLPWTTTIPGLMLITLAALPC